MGFGIMNSSKNIGECSEEIINLIGYRAFKEIFEEACLREQNAVPPREPVKKEVSF